MKKMSVDEGELVWMKEMRKRMWMKKMEKNVDEGNVWWKGWVWMKVMNVGKKINMERYECEGNNYCEWRIWVR